MSVSTTTTAVGTKRKRSAGSAHTGAMAKKRRVSYLQKNSDVAALRNTITEKKNLDITATTANIDTGTTAATLLLLNQSGAGSTPVTRVDDAC